MPSVCALAERLAGKVGAFKVGSQLFTAKGPEALRRVAEFGTGIFLDLKFHDIPNTVAGAVKEAAALPGVRMLTLHASGGARMLSAAREAISEMKEPPKLLGVTILTSMGPSDLREAGMLGSIRNRVLSLARMAQKAGMDGVVASPEEVAAIRKACGDDFLIVVPGIRPEAGGKKVKLGQNRKQDDQRRVATPGVAILAGADYLVIGRPILSAPDPSEAASAIAAEVAGAMPEAGRGHKPRWHGRPGRSGKS